MNNSLGKNEEGDDRRAIRKTTRRVWETVAGQSAGENTGGGFVRPGWLRTKAVKQGGNGTGGGER